MQFNINEHPHRRYNPLLDEWILVSPHRVKRPWDGQKEAVQENILPQHDPNCYLCSGNIRANGVKNPDYNSCYVFDNDFPALLETNIEHENQTNSLFQYKPEIGLNKVICFSPKHNITLAEMAVSEIENVIKTWKEEYINLSSKDYINYVQIFENKGSIMGCSNPHPHGQIWAQSSIPTQVEKTQKNLKAYFQKHKVSLLEDYLKQELHLQERIVIENEYFAVLVPFWATWPFETMIVSKRHFGNIIALTPKEINAFAEIIKGITVKYDNLFESSFPYSSGIHQAPTDNSLHPEWHFHMHFYPPLLRSATVKKFMVGYEMLGEAQRDITPEKSAEMLRNLPDTHYKINFGK
jgi:UDPglucose--hexose-1-phosphate uridylyltransferase